MQGRGYLIVVAVSSVVVIISLILIFVFNKSTPSSPKDINPTPTPNTTSQLLQPHAPASVPYFDAGQKKLLDYINNRRTLTPSDQQTRDELITLAGGGTGTVITTNDYRLEYIKSADAFMAEIDNPDVQSAKQELNDWLIQQGMSEEGICYLPLALYLSPQLASVKLINVIPFSPLPLGC